MTIQQKSWRVVVSVLSALCLIWLLVENLHFFARGFGVIEFRETDLIAMCLLSFTLMRAQWMRSGLVAANWVAIVIAGFTIVTKGIIMFLSEDGWIAGWHATNFAAGCCLLVLALESQERAKKMKPNNQLQSTANAEASAEPEP